MATKTMKRLNVFFPITRKERKPNGLLVEGYAYVNAMCDDGINLKRSAMEAATEDYMKWGAVREMHGTNAAGTATADECGVFWDDKGAFLRALIVDRDAIDKCEQGVYKAYSVGVRPQVMRGNDVEKLKWVENSLVDRPMDPDAAFSVVRSDDAPDGEFEVEVEPDSADPIEIPDADPNGEPNVERSGEADLTGEASTEDQSLTFLREFLAKRGMTLEEGIAALKSAPLSDPEPTEESPTDPEPTDEVAHADGIDSTTAPTRENLEGKPPKKKTPKKSREDDSETDRLEGEGDEEDEERGESSADPILSRLDALESLVKRFESALSVKDAEIERLNKLPAARSAPVRFPEALERTFQANGGPSEGDSEVERMRDEYKSLMESLATEKDAAKKESGVVRSMVLKQTLAQRGVTP